MRSATDSSAPFALGSGCSRVDLMMGYLLDGSELDVLLVNDLVIRGVVPDRGVNDDEGQGPDSEFARSEPKCRPPQRT